MATGFLFDENLPLALAAQLRRKAPTVRIFAVGFGEAPAKSTPDPALLCWLEDHDCWLVTNNRASMSVHLAAHLTVGHHIPGILTTLSPLRIRPLVNVLLLVWSVSLPDEYRDKITYLPFL